MPMPRIAIGSLVTTLVAAQLAAQFAPLQSGFTPQNGGIWTSIVADFDGDGAADVAVAHFFSATMAVMYWNDGEGRLTGPAALPVPLWQLTCLAAGDLDGDGDLDLLVGRTSDPGGGTDLMLRNDGGRVFTDVTATNWPQSSGRTEQFLIVDVDGDGDRDVVCANSYPNRKCGPACSQPSRLFRNDGSGRLTDVTATHMPNPGRNYTTAVAFDREGDGDIDLLLGSDLYVNNGGGAFARIPDWVGAVRAAFAADLDGDSDADLVLLTAGQLSVLQNTGGGNFAAVTALPAAGNAAGLQLGDLDRDGDQDLLFASGGAVRAWRNDGGLSFTDVSANWVASLVGGHYQAWLADFDRDGDLDLWRWGNGVELCWNDGSGRLLRLEPWASPMVNEVWWAMVPADLDADGHADAAALLGNTLRWWRGDGRGTLRDAGVSLAVINWCEDAHVLPLDADGDGRLDLYLGHCNQAMLLRGTATGFVDVTAVALPVDPTPALHTLAADFDGDGDLDLFTCKGSYGYPTVSYVDRLYVNRNGVFTDETAARMPPDTDVTTGAVAIDFDGDSDLDLALANPAAPVRLLRNDGTGTFTDATVPHMAPTAVAARALTVLDFDGDGDPDLAGGAPNSRLFLLRNDASTFVDVTAAGLPPGTQGGRTLLAFDADQDGDQDLLVDNRLLRNDGLGRFQEIVLPAGLGMRLRGALDFDGDGDLDLAGSLSGSIAFNLRRQLTVALPPRLGYHGELRLDTDGGSGPALAILALAGSLAQPPVALGSLGTMFLDPAQAFVHSVHVLPGTGSATVRYLVPRQPSLLGTSLAAQALFAHSPVDWHTGNAVTLRILL